MSIAARVDITAEDLRQAARQKGIDPDIWRVVKKPDGYCHIFIGVLSVGQLLLEDHAKMFVDMLNSRERS